MLVRCLWMVQVFMFCFVATMNGSVKYANFLVSLHSRRATVKPSRNQSAAAVDTRLACFYLCVLWSFSQLSDSVIVIILLALY